MPNKNPSQLGTEADFSGYFKEEKKAAIKSIKESAFQELPIKAQNAKRLKYFIVILAVIALVQFFLFYITNKTKYPGLPKDHQLITKPGQPPMVVPINSK